MIKKVTSGQSPCYKQKYERIMKRRGKKRTIIAIVRRILTAVHQMLNNVIIGINYRPFITG